MSKNIKTISDLTPDPQNPRKRTERSSGMLSRSLQEVGAARSIVIDENGQILAGNGTVEAAAEVGIENVKVVDVDGNTIVAVRRSGLTEEQKVKLALYDNRTADLATWDAEILLEIDREIDLSGFFTDIELNDLSVDLDGGGSGGDRSSNRKQRRGKDDAVDPEEVELRVKLGDLVLMGKHRLIVGDCTNPEVIERLMDGKKAVLCITDPPYNVDYDPEQRTCSFSEDRLKNPLGKIKNDVMSDVDFQSFLGKVYAQINNFLDAGCPIYIFHADAKGHYFRNAFMAQPWNMQSCLIWKKTVLAFGRADYHWIHEPILYGWKEGASHRYYGDRKQTTVIECASPHYDKENCDTDGYIHPTQKPTLILETFLNNSSQEGDIVIDFFGGSGSTLIACETTNRTCYTSELDPRFASAIITRWEEFTGKVAQIVPASVSDRPIPATDEALQSLGF